MDFSILSQNTLLVALLVVIISWLLNEWSKRRQEDYIRKEQRYSALLKSLKGFYVESESIELKEEFISQFNQCWLYCSDEVIQKGYNFLNTMHADIKVDGSKKETALGEFVLEIRRDIYARRFFRKTKLKPSDFKNFIAT